MNVGEDAANAPAADPAAPAEPQGPSDPTSAGAGAAERERAEVETDPVRLELAEARRAYDDAQMRLRQVSKAYSDLNAEMKAFKERMENRAKLDSEAQAYDQVKAFFEPVMNLKRSLGAGAHDAQSLVHGLNMVLGQFMDALQRLGLSEIPGEGAPFDPRVHEALAVQPVSEPVLDGKVLVVHTTGFMVGGRVLQPAQVVIGKLAEPAGEA